MGTLQSLACLAIENLVRKSLDQVSLGCGDQNDGDGDDHNDVGNNGDGDDNAAQVKDPGCRALISLTPDQQERAETIHSFVKVLILSC